MRRKILLFAVGLIIISVTITSVISVRVTLSNLILDRDQELLNYCSLINQALESNYSEGIEPDLPAYAEAFGQKIDERITFIARDGRVLADSLVGASYGAMENHLNREEVKSALSTGEGVSNRDSSTFGSGYIYAAKALEYDGEVKLVTRVAMEVDQLELVNSFVWKTTAISGLMGILAALIVSFFWSKKIIRPIKAIREGALRIAKGNYEDRIRVKTGDELEELGDTINRMAKELDATIEEMEKVDSIRKDFVANVTHELKTPLTSISGFVETLQEGAAEDPEVRERFLDIISIETTRLKRLIDDVLVISDIESGREARRDYDINIKEAVEEVISSIEPLIKENQINIVQDYAYEIYIGGNYDRFKQMMLNLIENAVKYSGPDTTVAISAEKQGNDVIIKVADEGIGIEEEHLSRVFERFYRVDKSRSQKAKGTGLGLAIVKHIAGLLGGSVSVESTPGAGTTFTVTIPQ